MSTFFKDLKKNQTVYVLNTTDFTVHHGVTTADASHSVETNAKTGQKEVMTSLPIDIDGHTATYMIPDKSSMTTAGMLILATTEDELFREVEAQERLSKKHIEDNPKHEMVIEKAPAAKVALNPALRERLEQEQRMKEMTDFIADMKERDKKRDEVMEKQQALIDKLLKKLDAK